MATWKKVIVSGSTANLSALQVDGLTSGNVVIGGGSGSVLTTTSINGTGNIVATTGATVNMSGSFSGSFVGSGAGLTGVIASSANALTAGSGLSAAGTYDGNVARTFTVDSGSLLPFFSSSIFTKVSGDITISTGGVAAIGSSKVTSAMIVDATITGTDIASATVANSNLVNSSITIGSTSTALGATSTTLAGLTSVTSTTFVGNLTGTATTASFALNAVSASLASTVTTNANLSGDVTSVGNVTTLATVATAGTTGGSTAIPVITINAKGLTTGITTAAVVAPAGTLSGATLASNVLASSLTSVGTLSSLTATNAVITNNLTVQGTASFQNTTNLEVADRFVLFASGSNTTGDGGIVIQQGTQNVGELYGYDSGTNRWAFTSSFTANQSSFTPAAYITTTEFAASNPSAAPLYGGASNGFGNIHVNSSTGDIFIYA